MTNKEGPDGWLSWHPDEGWDGLDSDEYIGTEASRSIGWVSKPVKILDFERWEKIQEWIKNVREYFQASVQGKLEGWECEKQKLDKLNNFLPEDK